MTAEFSVALHALVFLFHKKECVSSELLAQNVCTNPARIRKIMGKLVQAGFVKTRCGVDGGYFFSGDADCITVQDIVSVTDGNVINSVWKSGDKHAGCIISSGMGNVLDTIVAHLNACCRDYLSSLTVAQIEQELKQSVHTEK